jgi:hypothetical protein
MRRKGGKGSFTFQSASNEHEHDWLSGKRKREREEGNWEGREGGREDNMEK